VARDLGYAVEETPVSRDQLYLADEVFVCGTAAEVLGVVDIDGRKVGDGRPGAITTRLQHAYSEVVHGRHARSDEWLDYVNLTTENTVRG
jgi:branched-chain amino acid aminotransferase